MVLYLFFKGFCMPTPKNKNIPLRPLQKKNNDQELSVLYIPLRPLQKKNNDQELSVLYEFNSLDAFKKAEATLVKNSAKASLYDPERIKQLQKIKTKLQSTGFVSDEITLI